MSLALNSIKDKDFSPTKS